MSALLKDRNSDDKNLSTHSSRNRRSTQKWRDASPAALVKANLNNLDRLFAYVQDQPAFYRADFEMEALFAEVEAIAYSCESLKKPPLPKKVFVFARQTSKPPGSRAKSQSKLVRSSADLRRLRKRSSKQLRRSGTFLATEACDYQNPVLGTRSRLQKLMLVRQPSRGLLSRGAR